MSDAKAQSADINSAAILMMSLGNKEAVEIFKYLGPRQVQRLGSAMASLKDVPREKLDNVLKSFLQTVESQTHLGIGNDDHIRDLLVKALGEDKAAGVLDRILSGTNTKGLDTLKWMEPRAISDLIRNEHPQIQALILSYVENDQAAGVLKYLDDQTRLELMMRVSTLDTIQPMALQELNDIMEKQFSGNTVGKTRSVGGIKTAANIMNALDFAIEEPLLKSIKEQNPDLGQAIQDLMFVFENLLDVDDRGIQTLLREVSTDMLVVALKGADENVKEKIFKNISKRAAELLKDDLEAKGPVRLSEVEAAQKEILTVARRMSDSGEIILGSKGGEMMV